MTYELATIGYEGASTDAFDEALRCAGIELVVDVRAVALSRKRGFSKSALAQRLEEGGFGYVHLRNLGDPKPGRDAARAGEMARFRAIYSAHLATEAAQDELEQLAALATSRRTVMLCYEADATGCHRTMIAERIAKLANLQIVHLKVEGGRANVSGRARANHHPREGMAAA